VFARRKGVCEGYARLYVALGRAAGVEVSYVLGVAIVGKGVLALHAWNEARVGDRVEPIDVTWDAGTTDDAGAFHKTYSTQYFLPAREDFERDHLGLPQAGARFRRGCDPSTADLCLTLAAAYERGVGIAPDLEIAASLYRAACDAGRPVGCFNLAWMYEKGQGVAKSAGRTAAFFRKACDTGFAAGCNNAGVMYVWGQGVAFDMAKARSLFEAGCKGGEDDACANLMVLPP
jgi:hypothetical protein